MSLHLRPISLSFIIRQFLLFPTPILYFHCLYSDNIVEHTGNDHERELNTVQGHYMKRQ